MMMFWVGVFIGWFIVGPVVGWLYVRLMNKLVK